MSDTKTAPEQARVQVVFAGVAAAGVNPAEQRASRCASGYVFEGRLELLGEGGSVLLALPVQTGGWMSSDSPFARAGLCPADPTWGTYNPLHYPDTAFPALAGETTLGTLRTGRHRGFRVPDPPGTGRTYLMVHASTRFGSEGCISCPAEREWELFCEHMAALHESGVESIPLRVVYACRLPEPMRCQSKETDS